MPEPPPPTRCGDIALAGRPNVGKSSLLNALVGEHLALVSARAQATRLPVVGIHSSDDTQYVFHDLPGLLDPAYLMHDRMLAAAHEIIRQVDVILYLVPATDGVTTSFADSISIANPPRGQALTVYTKGDLVSPEERERLGATGLVVSSKEGWGLQELLAEVRAQLPEGPFRYDPDELGTQPLRFFATEYVREAAFEVLEQELPYALTAVVEEFRENEEPMYIRVTIIVERDSQKGIVIGKGGRTIKRVGSLARARLEQLTGVPVYLDLWVKVLKNWRKNPIALTRLGFPPSDKETA
jgi:GTP-binding protein Era